MDYWQVIRRLPDGGHQSIADFRSVHDAQNRAREMNADYQTDEYKVIHRTSEGLAKSMGAWWDGRKWPEEWL